MTLVQYVYLYLLTAPVFFAIDLVWLGLVARGFYQRELAAFVGPVNWTAAVLFYLLYIVGILVFAVLPGIRAQSLLVACAYGALFGCIAYATYDLTNLATLKGWPLSVTLVDLAWGTVLTASVASLSYLLAVRLVL